MKPITLTGIAVAKFLGKDVQVEMVDNEPWLVAVDVCRVLGYSNERDAVETLVEPNGRVKLVVQRPKTASDLPSPEATAGHAGSPGLPSPEATAGQGREMWLLNEGGLFALVLGSRKPAAKQFRNWVCMDLLPSVRRAVMAYKEAEVRHFKWRTTIAERQLHDGRNDWLLDVLRYLEHHPFRWQGRAEDRPARVGRELLATAHLQGFLPSIGRTDRDTKEFGRWFWANLGNIEDLILVDTTKTDRWSSDTIMIIAAKPIPKNPTSLDLPSIVESMPPLLAE